MKYPLSSMIYTDIQIYQYPITDILFCFNLTDIW